MAQRKAKLPKPTKIPRPLARDLRANYKKLITLSPENRIAALSMAIQWYINAVYYLMQKTGLTPAQMKQLEEAAGFRRNGIKTPNLDIKEISFGSAIHTYEKVCGALNPVLVEPFYKVFESRRETLVKKQARLESKYGEPIRLLQKAVGKWLTLNIADAAKPGQYDPYLRSISFNREALKRITEKYRKEGLLAVFIEHLEVFAQQWSVTPDGNGKFDYDPVKHILAMKDLLKEFLEFAKTSECPNRLVKKVAVK